jgi:hypothetical protein
MAMATVIWAAVAGVIITAGATDAVITTAGRAAIIITITDIAQEAAMPGLIGYMLAIVVTLGGYFAGLHWLISPPDPWQPNAKIPASTAQPFAARKRPSVVKPAEAAASQSAAVMKPDATMASAEMPASVASGDNEPARPVEPDAVETRRPAAAALQAEAPRPAAEPAHIVRRDASPKARPANRKRVEGHPGRKLELMVLRTYERSDGRRFTRLLPLNSARNAMAFQPDDPW